MNPSIFIDPSEKLKDALRRLDGSTYGVLLVVDAQKRLLGTLTDGDARRAILSGRSLDEAIVGAFNSAPHSLSARSLDTDLARKWFLEQHFHLIPVLDSAGCVTEVLTWDKFLGGDTKAPPQKRPRENIDLPIVIMAGGKGSRLEPFTNILPKPLVPIQDRTILELIIDGFREVGVKKFSLTLNYKAEMIRAYLDGIEKDYEVQYFYEKQFYGTAGSLRLVRDQVGGDFIVSNCDVIVKANWAKVLKLHRESNAALTVVSSIQRYQIPYGVIEFLPGGRVTAIVEKPEYTFPINTGVYIMNEQCLDLIPQDAHYHMTDLIAELVRRDRIVVTYPVSENEYMDIGQWDDYRATVNKLRV